MRNACAHAFGIFGLLRGDNQRGIELSDLGSMLLEGEGTTECFAVVVTLRKGKTHTAGKVSYAGFMRNANVAVCPVWFLALYLFVRYVWLSTEAGQAAKTLTSYRFSVDKESFVNSTNGFPDLSKRESWYFIKLLRGDKGEMDGITYTTQHNAVRAAHAKADVTSSKSTHAGRRGGARVAERAGAAVTDIARAGNWSTSVLENVYLDQLPRGSMRAQAGFRPEGGTFWLPRAVDVPEDLQRAVFPQTEKW